MGPERASTLMSVGCNDMGASLMNESITRAAGASHGQVRAGCVAVHMPARQGCLRLSCCHKDKRRRVLAGQAGAVCLPCSAAIAVPCSAPENLTFFLY